MRTFGVVLGWIVLTILSGCYSSRIAPNAAGSHGIEPAEATIKVDHLEPSELQLHVFVENVDGSREAAENVAFEVDDPSFGSVDENGVFHTTSEETGDIVITARVGEGAS